MLIPTRFISNFISESCNSFEPNESSKIKILTPRFAALINGKRQTLEVVGIGLSPDYIYATRGGAFPDDRSFGVIW